MSIVDTFVGVGGDIAHYQKTLSAQERRDMEGRVLRLSFVAMAFAVVALYAASVIDDRPLPKDTLERVTPAPLL